MVDKQEARQQHLHVVVPYAEMPAPILDADESERQYGQVISGQK